MTVSEDLYFQTGPGPAASLTERFLPVYDVSDGVAVVVEAEPRCTWESLMQVDLIELGRDEPVIALLGALRALPGLLGQVLHGERPAYPEHLGLRDLAEMPAGDGGWTLLAQIPGQGIALGLVGKFWRPVIEYANVPTDQFAEFAEPGWGKTVYALTVHGLDDGRSLLAGEMRTATTDEHSRRWFRRYWTFGVGSGAHVLVAGLLDAARADAESKPGVMGR